MSLARLALRMSVVRALADQTRAGGNVLDSRIGVLEVDERGNTLTTQTRPFIAVYTAGSTAADNDMRSLRANGKTWLTIELGVTAAMAVVDEETGARHLLPGIPATDDAMEMLLDLVARDIENALSDDANSWAEIYRGLVNDVHQIEIEPLRNGDDGQRLAARQIRIQVGLVPDPVYGARAPADTVFGSFLAALDAAGDPASTTRAGLIRAAIGTGGAADHEATRRRFAMSRCELLALGLGPIEGDTARATPPWLAAKAEVDGMKPVTIE